MCRGCGLDDTQAQNFFHEPAKFSISYPPKLPTIRCIYSTCTCTYTCIYTIYMCAWLVPSISAYSHVHLLSTPAHTHTHIHTHTHTHTHIHVHEKGDQWSFGRYSCHQILCLGKTLLWQDIQTQVQCKCNKLTDFLSPYYPCHQTEGTEEPDGTQVSRRLLRLLLGHDSSPHLHPYLFHLRGPGPPSDRSQSGSPTCVSSFSFFFFIFFFFFFSSSSFSFVSPQSKWIFFFFLFLFFCSSFVRKLEWLFMHTCVCLYHTCTYVRIYTCTYM